MLALAGTRGTDGMIRVRAQCSFAARLGSGRYFITLRLEDRRSDDVFFPLDKQAGILGFEVIQPRREFLGAIDIGMRWSELAVT